MYPVNHSTAPASSRYYNEQRRVSIQDSTSFDQRAPLNTQQTPQGHLFTQSISYRQEGKEEDAGTHLYTPRLRDFFLQSQNSPYPQPLIENTQSNKLIKEIQTLSEENDILLNHVFLLSQKPIESWSNHLLTTVKRGLIELTKSSVLTRAKIAGFDNYQIFSIFKRSAKNFVQSVHVFDSFISRIGYQRSGLDKILNAGFSLNQIKSLLTDTRGKLQQSIKALDDLITDKPTEQSLLQCLKYAGFTTDQISSILMYSSGQLPKSVKILRNLVAETPLRPSVLSCARQVGLTIKEITYILSHAKGNLDLLINSLDSMVRPISGNLPLFERLKRAGFPQKLIVTILGNSRGKIPYAVNFLKKAEFSLYLASDKNKISFLEKISIGAKDPIGEWLQKAEGLLKNLGSQNNDLEDINMFIPESEQPINPEELTEDFFEADDMSLSSEGWVYDHLQLPPAASST